MIRKSLLLKLYDSAGMERWNDKMRPVELREMDKQAHKMVIAYMLAKSEGNNPDLDWIEIIEGGIFDLLQRIVVTDLKPPFFHRIEKDREQYEQLNRYVIKELKDDIAELGNDFFERFQYYLLQPKETINRRILNAAHYYATSWEFDIIERANPNGYEMAEIRKQIEEKSEQYYDLKGIQLLTLYRNLKNFSNLCGELRFQIRWSHLHRIPRTSVLGHMLVVAISSYLFSLEIGACPQRCINNYFTGLFHDLPEVLTRDIISPVKAQVVGLDKLIKQYEQEEMLKIYAMVPQTWHADLRMYTENEFEGRVNAGPETKPVSSAEISKQYNKDSYNPRDGEIIKAMDELAAFMEAHLAVQNGMQHPRLKETITRIKDKYNNTTICGVSLGAIYKDFS